MYYNFAAKVIIIIEICKKNDKKHNKNHNKKPLSLSGFFVAGPRIENGNAIIVPLWLRTWDLMIHNQTKNHSR